MVHGVGVLVFQSYPQQEKQGANLFKKILFRSLVRVLKHLNVKRFRNVYNQFDNGSVNKNWLLLAALGSLLLLGSFYIIQILSNLI